jgi:citrate synthase
MRDRLIIESTRGIRGGRRPIVDERAEGEGRRPEIHRGLDNVYVKETRICFVDGARGRLLYRGYDIRDLAAHSTFEETAYLVWHGRLPTRGELDSFRSALAKERFLPPGVLKVLRALPKETAPIDALRTGVSALAGYDPDLRDASPEANMRKAVRLTAKFPTLVAAFHRLRQGRRPVSPNPDLSHAVDFLRMVRGRKPSRLDGRVMDLALILHADHSMNASTFAATVAASTLADLYAAAIAGVSALQGPLHGGANEQALQDLLTIPTPEAAEDYVLKRLARKEKVFGFGHRVYKTHDPRSRILRESARKLSRRRGERTLFDVATAVEETMIRQLGERGIYPNVDFYAGLTYHLLGLPPSLFPSVFAVSRIVGWTAHVLEYWEANRLMRPLDWYVGPRETVYVPPEER